MDDLERRKTIEPKFGLILPPVIDPRTIPLRALVKLKLLPPLPDSFDVDVDLEGVTDNNMFGNDVHSDCVKAAIAHFILRLEKFEQGIIIPITADEVVADYFRETGGADSGLVFTYAMKDWRNAGIAVGGKTYTIDAFTGIDTKDHTQVKYSIYLLRGFIFGMNVYSTDVDQWRKGEKWHLTGSNGTLEGGHGVYIKAYGDGVTCITWATEQPMDWDFFDARTIQAYAVVDNKDEWLGDNSPINIPLMESYLKEITGTADTNNSGCSPLGLIKRLLTK